MYLYTLTCVCIHVYKYTRIAAAIHNSAFPAVRLAHKPTRAFTGHSQVSLSRSRNLKPINRWNMRENEINGLLRPSGAASAGEHRHLPGAVGWDGTGRARMGAVGWDGTGRARMAAGWRHATGRGWTLSCSFVAARLFSDQAAAEPCGAQRALLRGLRLGRATSLPGQPQYFQFPSRLGSVPLNAVSQAVEVAAIGLPAAGSWLAGAGIGAQHGLQTSGSRVASWQVQGWQC